MPLSAYTRFVLIRIKIERANQHLDNLERLVESCRGKEFTASIGQDDPQTKKIIGYRDETHPVYPFELLSAAGDVVHCLRSALDHLAFQLAAVGSGKVPSRCVTFPIAKDRDTYEREKARKVEGIRPEAIKEIDRLEPYKGGTKEFSDTLWRIHELDIIDKHRFVFVVANDAFFEADWYADDHPFLIRPRTFKADTPHFSGVLGADVDDDVSFAIEEAVGQAQIVKGDSLLPALREYIQVVRGLVKSFKPFLV
jgi:hypothetical protein